MNTFQLKTIAIAVERGSKLTIWERSFIKDMNNKPDDYELSERQNHTLNQIRQKL